MVSKGAYILHTLPIFPELKLTVDYICQNLNHNTMGGKYNRGMSVVDTASLILSRELTEGEFFLSATLGWCTELLQAFFLVSDDIMDSFKTRRGRPCWYLVPNMGMIAINDAFMLESSIYALLKKYFRSRSCYVELLVVSRRDLSDRTGPGMRLAHGAGRESQSVELLHGEIYVHRQLQDGVLFILPPCCFGLVFPRHGHSQEYRSGP